MDSSEIIAKISSTKNLLSGKSIPDFGIENAITPKKVQRNQPKQKSTKIICFESRSYKKLQGKNVVLKTSETFKQSENKISSKGKVNSLPHNLNYRSQHQKYLF